MSSKPNDFKIGLFVFFGIALLLAALFIFGASKWFQSKTIAETYVEGNTDGLKVGAPVTLQGVPVGQVTRINFTWNIYHKTEPRFVYVEFEMDKKVSLVPPGPDFARLVEEEVRKGLRARIKSQGLAAGTSLVSLEYLNPTENAPHTVSWKPRHIFIPSAPSQLSEIMTGLDKTIAGFKQIDFAKIGDLLKGDLSTGGKLLNHADELNLPKLGTNLNGLVEDMRGLSAQLRGFVGSTNELAGADLQHITRRADELVGQLQAAAARLDRDLANLDFGSLNETLENFRRASRELNQTLSRIKQYPAGALLGRPPPPAKSVERIPQ